VAARAPRTAPSPWPVIRCIDVFVSVIALLFLAPVMLLAAATVTLQDGGPPLYAQERVGRGGRAFRCYKFRSMVMDSQARLADLLAKDPAARMEWEQNHKLRRDPRITFFGHFLRKSSLDELPQLFNILRGEMSVVGPRPIVREEIHKYGRFFRYYTKVTPGLTGLWQVSGRNNVDYGRRVSLDVLYVRKRSPILNLYIMAKTIPAVLAQRGTY
jgi:lipopolysaccharide/colanic/teichoic acid biosynthesis glycosyltransferase